ncbi:MULTISPECIES: S-methyl-5'-thioadenosine phosphorylase [Streptomycetaceae]|uniref:S-methyl-5'-thioadenosine phosphorylase n=1 Tax=Streptantibioticus cattleyicolor (strain ATCC 35852 / DSM 46488 / JCM 4925 / NBRC 14057 / NRRL 8057) TaxID=1003195 RepID=F8JPG5_STREN|nr:MULTISPECIES: S-methyl-5'-thioadenosine phosphorylase [Streptomycetaceae]AEW96526.1 5'-fluoro-5'-deoxy-adenosine phosphorylase [Streptantibioticus cattleyicolor NRRL 8057 = DSM 46488]MYS61027.1 S-methyl-5'-thioadenosine phosphorylase [Streptomyces sp. SID5468]CCB76862.1 5'-fluoro-5'-deoxy-adenosine phosphorylase (PNPase) [Streptantibioticus cattleyicolor NRRL 8057 = DSM 46488]
MRARKSGNEQRNADLGIIGGSGLYEFPGLTDPEEFPVETPYGPPSAPPVVGTVGGRRVAFLARHGTGHRIPPSRIPVRANLYALKALGVTEVVSVSAVGSLREEYAPGHLVVPDQIVDRTRGGRPATFFSSGVVVHVSLADPYCPRLRAALTDAARAAHPTVHPAGTYLCMEGPQFSTRAESQLYRAWGMDVIGMTAQPEAKLAREAELCYAGLSLVTDYDCWHTGHDSVDARTVAEVMAANVIAARAVLSGLAHATAPADCACHHALDGAVLTDPLAAAQVPEEEVPALLRKGFARRG